MGAISNFAPPIRKVQSLLQASQAMFCSSARLVGGARRIRPLGPPSRKGRPMAPKGNAEAVTRVESHEWQFSSKGDRQFESALLQRRIRNEPTRADFEHA